MYMEHSYQAAEISVACTLCIWITIFQKDKHWIYLKTFCNSVHRSIVFKLNPSNIYATPLPVHCQLQFLDILFYSALNIICN